ncbi:UDP-N-acetylmuramate dehydrogenase [uncultured Planktosalinus sp.]|uniref:UDP-N-acetylmuramate dehydrogenase n=1 Tax=uncultured Planktosalinus sp. TaxID=1810935 RepID=UPI0030DA27BA
MLIQEHINLKPYNTFGVTAYAKYFVEVTSVEELIEVLGNSNYPELFILGGGSNMLLTKDIDALVIYINLKGISIDFEDNNFVHLKVMAGENWHQLVLYCLENNYGGIENLSLIPGNTGSAPIQNIGAYGVELKDVFISCKAMQIENGEMKTFDLEACKFGYRSSLFKTNEKGNYIISSVTLKLTKKDHKINVDYGAIQEELLKLNVESPTIQDVSKAVIAIRQSKLPDPNELGNSGSFFKNPVIDNPAFEVFISQFPEAPFYKISESEYKIPAGWLIEQAGFKGKRFGDAGVHTKQALVLVNYDNASGADILNLSKKIQQKVKHLFDIALETEVNIV